MKTDRGEFSWKCDCGEAQPYDWKSLKFETITRDQGGVDEQATSETARMVCRECEKEYTDTTANRRKLSESNMDNGQGGYISTN